MSIYSHDTKNSINKYNLINEAYIGKTETLLEIEKKIHELREVVSISTSSSSKVVLEINRLIEKQFGMNIFALKILNTAYYDAYTISLGYQYDLSRLSNLRDYVVGDKDTGYRFRKDNKFCIVTNISYGLLSKNNNITDAEVLAIILHEIGHNFGDIIYDDLLFANRKAIEAYYNSLIYKFIFDSILTVCTMGLTLPVVFDDIKSLNQINNKKVAKKENKNRKKRSNRVSKFFDNFSNFIAGKKGSKNDKDTTSINNYYRLSGMYTKERVHDSYDKKYGPDYPSKIRNSIDRQGEVMADRFAEIYGYGLELASALAKMSSISDSKAYKEARKAAKHDNYYLRANDEFEEAFFDMNDYDVHPETIQRINSNIASMKREAEKDDIDPKVKKEILNQISDMEKLLKDLLDSATKVYHIDKAQAIYRSYLNETLPDGIDEEINEKIDAAFDKKLESIEKK